MKKISIFFFGFVLFLQFLFVGGAWGQSTANYAFTTNATGSLALDANGNAVDMTTGTTQLVAAAQDATVSSVTSIGFNYYFMSNLYSQFTASASLAREKSVCAGRREGSALAGQAPGAFQEGSSRPPHHAIPKG